MSEAADTDLQLPFTLEEVEPQPAGWCWYCGTTAGPFESEHQTPVSRGGKWGSNVVTACTACNDLKGPLTLDEFRAALAARIGSPLVVFAGEVAEDAEATAIRSVRSLGANREVVRLDPVVGEELTRAVMYLRGTGQPRMTRKELAGALLAEGLSNLASTLLDSERFPADGPQPTLFDDDQIERRPILQPGQLSHTPRVPMAREVTKIDGATLEAARWAVNVLREHEHRDLALYAFISSAVDRLVREVADRYPEKVAARTDTAAMG